MNLTLLLANYTTNSSIEAYASSVVKVDLPGLDEVETTQLTAEVSDKPCGDALSSQAPPSVKLPGSLDALLYIVIVLMFYAFSIVILMVKYIRREREEAGLRNYYHEFVSRDKFRSVQYKNHQFMKRMFNNSSDADQETITSIETEEEQPWTSRKKKSQPQTIVKNGNVFSKLRLECDDDELCAKEKRFTFLTAKSQFCKNSHFGSAFCNKQLCPKCVSENVPTIDWDDGIEESNNVNNKSDVIEVKLHPSVESLSQQRSSILGCGDSSPRERYNARMTALDNLFFPIIECDSEHETGAKQPQNNVATFATFGHKIGEGRGEPCNVPRESSFDDPVIVSSCSLEVSELLANMPPLGISNSVSNDMDTLDGLSNLESEAENQSLLNYSSSIWHHNEIDARSLSQSGEGSNLFPINGTDKSDKLSDRSSLLSCSLLFDSGGKSVTTSHPFTSINLLSSSENINMNPKKSENIDVMKDNNKVSLSSSFSFSEKDRDKEMVRLLNDINLLADESGVFKNLKYFLRGFYKSDTDDATETSNLLPKETYFGPDSPKSSKGTALSPVKGSNGDILSIPSMEECLQSASEDIVNSLGSHWAYAYDAEEDGIISDTERSSSFGDYCMGDTTESQAIDLSMPLAKRHIDSAVRDGLGKAIRGLNNSSFDDDQPPPKKPNPMLAGYGMARKETKV